MNVLVIGVGSIGERHVRNLLSLNLHVSVFDIDRQRAQEISCRYAVDVFPLLDNSFHSFQLVLICTPTYTHVGIATKAIQEGCHVFIEKPIAEKSSAELDSLVQLARSAGKTTFVGCNMRFHQAIQEIKTVLDSGAIGKVYGVRAHFGHFLPNWRKTDYQTTYSAQANQGGGILLECIHEFDYLRWLFGNVTELSAQATKSGALVVDAEDLAEVTFSFHGGVIGHLHADCLQQTKRRGCEIVAEKGTLLWESIGKNPEIATLSLLRKNGEAVEQRVIPIDLDEMYREEIRYLIEMIQQGKRTMNDVVEAAKTLRLVEIARDSAREGVRKVFPANQRDQT